MSVAVGGSGSWCEKDAEVATNVTVRAAYGNLLDLTTVVSLVNAQVCVTWRVAVVVWWCSCVNACSFRALSSQRACVCLWRGHPKAPPPRPPHHWILLHLELELLQHTCLNLKTFFLFIQDKSLVNVTVASNKGTKENDVCSGRGACDYATGFCKCNQLAVDATTSYR